MPGGDDIQQLFDRDPLELTDAELDELILYYRRARTEFLQREAQKKLTGRRTPEAAGIRLEDLNITF